MEQYYLTLKDVANIVTLIIPGYVAARAYASVYAKGDKEFARIFIESIVLSLPIVAIFNALWPTSASASDSAVLSPLYVVLLLLFSATIGLLGARVRRFAFIKLLLRPFSVPAPDEDFIRQQFGKLTRNEVVSVTLQNGDVFSGTPQGGNIYHAGHSRQYYFNNIAWYNKDTGAWEERSGSIIIDLSHVLHIETERKLPKD